MCSYCNAEDVPLFSFDQVRRVAEEVVRENPEFVYDKDVCGIDGKCVYAKAEDGLVRASCVVGRIVLRLDLGLFLRVAKLENERMNSAVFDSFSAERINDLLSEVIFDERTMAFLQRLQTQQDQKDPWGKALESAEARDAWSVRDDAVQEDNERGTEQD